MNAALYNRVNLDEFLVILFTLNFEYGTFINQLVR